MSADRFSPVPIAFFIDKLQIGGAQRHVVDVVTRLDRTEFTPHVITLTGEGPYGPYLTEHSIEILDLEIPHPARTVRTLTKVFDCAGFLKERKIQILNMYLYMPVILGDVAARFAGIPVTIASKRSLDILDSPKRAVAEKFFRRRATAQTAVSEAVRKTLISQGDNPENIYTLYNGFDFNTIRTDVKVREKRDEFNLRGDEWVVGIVANLNKHKGHVTLLKAASAVVQKVPQARFLLVGEGKLRDQLVELAEKLHIQDKIIFAGSRTDVLDLYQIMDIFVLSSLHEGLSNALIEASAHGLPSIATDVGGNPEVIEHRTTGLLVPVEDPDALAEAIIELGTNRQYAKELGLGGKRRIQEVFSIERTILAYKDLYQRLLSELD